VSSALKELTANAGRRIHAMRAYLTAAVEAAEGAAEEAAVCSLEATSSMIGCQIRSS
jgi:hypothetical protein